MRASLLASLSAVLLLARPPASPVQDDDSDGRPNVLFIVVDDLNDWVGPLGGHPQAKTPSLDRLATLGTTFTNAHAPASVCHPSRTAILTGVPPNHSGLYRNTVRMRDAFPDVETLPQCFRRAGYLALGAGKVFHFPDRVSWDRYFPSLRRQRPEDPRPEDLPRNGLRGVGNLDWGALDVPDQAMGDARIAAWAVEVLGEEHARPFFLALGFYRPHLPWFVPRAYHSALAEDVALPAVLADDLADVPADGLRLARGRGEHPKILEAESWGDAVRAYLASIAFVDAQIGRVLDALAGSQHADDTLVVLFSDHGFHLGEKEHWRKTTGWEETTRVPLLVAGPGVRAGARSSRPVSLQDLFPTLVERCGLAPTGDPERLGGLSLLPLLLDPEAERDVPALTTFAERGHSLRSEHWRLVSYADGTRELYDHRTDPHEWHNLAGSPEHAAVERELVKQLPAHDARDVTKRFGGR